MRTLRVSTSERVRWRAWVGASSGGEFGEGSVRGLLPPFVKGDVMDLNHELRLVVLALEDFSSESVLWRERSGDLDAVR